MLGNGSQNDKGEEYTMLFSSSTYLCFVGHESSYSPNVSWKKRIPFNLVWLAIQDFDKDFKKPWIRVEHN